MFWRSVRLRSDSDEGSTDITNCTSQNQGCEVVVISDPVIITGNFTQNINSVIQIHATSVESGPILNITGKNNSTHAQNKGA
jgi:hypothetical protein